MSNRDEVYIKTPFFTFGVKTSHIITLEKGQTIFIKSWNWRKFGWTRKAVTNNDGIIEVKMI